ncbi:MAG: Gfo/Idh/MocA family protein [Acidobacteriota bacterium]
MRSLVIGYGSIGARHARVLQELNCPVAVVSHRLVEFELVYNDLASAVAGFSPDYVIVANKTSEHYDTLIQLAGLDYRGTVLVEKPLFDNYKEIPAHQFKNLFIGYNLRFHPLLQRLRELLSGEDIISVQAYVGQYLPTWRLDNDYSESYSAKKAEGGGALRDLSHELDYLNWLLGGWQNVAALGGKYSDLKVETDDVFSIMMTTGHCPIVSVQMNYLDRLTRREVLINTKQHTLKLDFIKCCLEIDQECETCEVARDVTYRNQHLAVINNQTTGLCSAKQGLHVMKIIHAVETAVKERRWVANEE